MERRERLQPQKTMKSKLTKRDMRRMETIVRQFEKLDGPEKAWVISRLRDDFNRSAAK